MWLKPDVHVKKLGDRWELLTPICYIYYNEETKITINVTVPERFTTDFASVPKMLRSFLSPSDSDYCAAAVVHDYLYSSWDKPYRLSRKFADLIFLEAMKDLGCGYFKRMMLYRAVRLFGSSSFKGLL